MEKAEDEITHKISAYKIIHSSGNIEFLQGYTKGDDLKYPTSLVSVAGYKLEVVTKRLDGSMRFTGLRDMSGTTLLDVQYNGDKATLILYPDTPESYCIVLRCNNGHLQTITRESPAPDNESLVWVLDTIDIPEMGKWVTSLTTPTGMTETVLYQLDGHRFPEAAPQSQQDLRMPYVYSYTKNPGAGQPKQVSEYSYPTPNYLGYGLDINAWDGNDDYLYASLEEYNYSSEETRHNNGGENQVITRIYNNYHLQITEKICGEFSSQKDTGYNYIKKNTKFDDQPANFQFPTDTTTWANKSDGKNPLSRKERVTTEFSDKGLRTKQTDADGTETQWEYYPAEGSGADCPSEPNGFTRFVMTQQNLLNLCR